MLHDLFNSFGDFQIKELPLGIPFKHVEKLCEQFAQYLNKRGIERAFVKLICFNLLSLE